MKEMEMKLMKVRNVAKAKEKKIANYGIHVKKKEDACSMKGKEANARRYKECTRISKAISEILNIGRTYK